MNSKAKNYGQPRSSRHPARSYRRSFYSSAEGSTTHPEAFDIVARGEEALTDIAQQHRLLQAHHTGEHYRLRDTNPEEAEVHHGLKYDHLGQAALIERAQLGIRWGSRPSWVFSKVVDMLGIGRMEEELEARLEKEATTAYLKREKTLSSRVWIEYGVPGIPAMKESDMRQNEAA